MITNYLTDNEQEINNLSIYIGLFGLLYLIVAFSSFFHAVSFFGLANNSWMSIILAFAFEVGQAAVLFSLLTSVKDRSRIMPWILMTMFTLVQVIGNVYSSYKYIITNSVDNLRYFKEPIFIWTDLPDDQANVIIVYLVGALLPIAALLLTSMITNYLTDNEQEINNLSHSLSQNTENNLINTDVQKIENNLSEDTDSDGSDKVNIDNIDNVDNVEEIKEDSKEDDIKPDIIENDQENKIEKDQENKIENDQENKEVEEPEEDTPSEEALKKFEEIENKRNNKTSHFINI
jgi:hypothetical protein